MKKLVLIALLTFTTAALADSCSYYFNKGVDLYQAAAGLDEKTSKLTFKLAEADDIASGCKMIVDIKANIQEVKRQLGKTQEMFQVAISECGAEDSRQAMNYRSLSKQKSGSLEEHYSKVFELDQQLCR